MISLIQIVLIAISSYILDLMWKRLEMNISLFDIEDGVLAILVSFP